MLHWSYTPEQKEEVKKALAAGVPKATILTYLLLSGGADGKNEFISKEAVKLSHRHGNYAILCLCKSKGICKLDFMEVKDGKRMFA